MHISIRSSQFLNPKPLDRQLDRYLDHSDRQCSLLLGNFLEILHVGRLIYVPCLHPPPTLRLVISEYPEVFCRGIQNTSILDLVKLQEICANDLFLTRPHS